MLSCQVCQALGRIEELIELLPLAKKFQVMPAADCVALELEAYSLSLKQAVEDAEPANKPNQWPLALKTTWAAIPKALQLEPGLIKILIQGLMNANASELAVKELEKALKKAPEDELFVLYAQIQSEDPSARLAFLDKLGKGLKHRAPLDFARGQLAWRRLSSHHRARCRGHTHGHLGLPDREGSTAGMGQGDRRPNRRPAVDVPDRAPR